MSEAVKIANLDDVKQGKMFRAKINDNAILLANIENEIFAIDDMCIPTKMLHFIKAH